MTGVLIRDRRGREGHVKKMEAGVRGMWPQAQEPRAPGSWQTQGTDSPLEPEGVRPCQQLDFRLLLYRTVRN